jgi:DNA adenine methylase
MIEAQPFLRWAGGKRQLVPSLIAHLPLDIAERKYIEPFLGAASLFFALKPAKAVLGDANKALIATYRAIRDEPERVREHLAALIKNHNSINYYKIRKKYNDEKFSSEQAARFIYLNKACFNGIFRVNRKGEFNVPKGSKDKLALPTQVEYKPISEALKKATLCPFAYTTTLKRASTGDFVYLDPPYPALNGTAYFNHYTADRFDVQAQADLASEVQALHNRGVLFLMSNADVPVVRELYASFSIYPIEVRRFITCKKDRMQVSELLIRNY